MGLSSVSQSLSEAVASIQSLKLPSDISLSPPADLSVIATTVENSVNGVTSTFSGISEFTLSSTTTAGTAASELLGEVGSAGAAAQSSIVTFNALIPELTKSLVESITDAIASSSKSLADSLSGTLAVSSGALSDSSRAIAGGLASTISASTDAAAGLSSAVKGGIEGSSKAVVEGVTGASTGALQQSFNIASTVGKELSKVFILILFIYFSAVLPLFCLCVM